MNQNNVTNNEVNQNFNLGGNNIQSVPNTPSVANVGNNIQAIVNTSGFAGVNNNQMTSTNYSNQYSESNQLSFQNQQLINQKTEQVPKLESRNNNRRNNKFIMYGVIILTVLVGVFLLCKTSLKKEDISYDDFEKSDSFFIENNEGYYALFNEDGKQLTEFEFLSIGSFYGGSAVVINKDYKKGVIRENGEYLIPVSENDLSDNYGLYITNNSQSSIEQVKNFRGEVIAEGAFVNIDNYASGAMFSIDIKDESYNSVGDAEIVNYAGKSMGTLANIDDYSSYSYDEAYVTLLSEEKTVLYNVEAAQKILETEGRYCVYWHTDNTVILQSCSSWGSSDNEKLYKVVKNGKVIYTINSDDYQLILTEDDEVLLRKYSEDYYSLLDDKGNVKQDFIVGYQNGKNYIVKQDNQLVFYKNNQKEKSVKCVDYAYIGSDDLYVMKFDVYDNNCTKKTDNLYSYYNLTGEKVSDDYYSVSAFNQVDRAMVNTGKNDEYVINKDFEILSDSYVAIRENNGLYIATDKEDKTYLLDKEGKVLENNVVYSIRYGGLEADNNYVAIKNSDNYFIVYNVKDNKKIAVISGKSINLYEHYFIVDSNYYLYKNGKQFYSEN